MSEIISKVFFNLFVVFSILNLVSCDISIDGAPLGSTQLNQLLVNQGQSLTGGVTSISSNEGKNYQFAYNQSYLFYTSSEGTGHAWNFLPLSSLGGANIVNVSPYYIDGVVPQVLVLTDAPTNNLWLCSNLNTYELSCTSDINLLPNTLTGHTVHHIVGNNNIQYAIVDNNVILMSLHANNYQVMPNIPTLKNNSPILALNTDMAGNLYVIFFSDALGNVLYEFDAGLDQWKLLLQNDQLIGSIAANNNGDVYLLQPDNNGSCDKNNYWVFTIKHIVDQKIVPIGMAINGCNNNRVSLLNISIDSNHHMYITTKTGDYLRVYYNPNAI